jgi:hypothetical protein
VATIRIPAPPSEKFSREQAQVISPPSAAPKPRSRSSRTVPPGGSRLASWITWRRCGLAGPNARAARSAPLRASSAWAPTGLAQNTRVPSIDHSHAGRLEVAWTASRGSATPRN